MMKIFQGIYFTVSLFVLCSFRGTASPRASSIQTDSISIQRIIHTIQRRYAPDVQLAVFAISWSSQGQTITLRGELDNPQAKITLIRSIQKKIKGNVIDSIRLLPDQSLGENIKGIIVRSVVNICRNPGPREELLTQALMGTVVNILKEKNGYVFVQTSDRYLGWLDRGSIVVTNEAGIETWNAAAKVIVTKFSGNVLTRTAPASEIVCEIIDGCILKNNGEKDGWRSVELADGRTGFVPDTMVQDLEHWEKNRHLTGENLEKTARSFLGIKYLWGGMSVKGMDCSGFVKTVYHLNGVELNRDAHQQAHQGVPVEPGENFQNLKKGDLLFFGRTANINKRGHVTHVGMYLEDGLYIHSSKRVRLSSLLSTSDYYEEPLLRRFLFARRIVQN